MAKKIQKHEYQVKYKIKAIVGVTVVATDEDNARRLAGEVVSKNIFCEKIESLDERNVFLGFDDITEWEL